MSNTYTFNTKLAPELDKLLVAKSAAGILVDDSFATKFVGAKTIAIPDISVSGLGDYDREKGFAKGNITVRQDTYQLEMERSTSFCIDRIDEDETGIANLAGQVMGEFVRTQVVPEIDSYVFSKILDTANPANVVAGTTASAFTNSCVSLLQNAIDAVSSVSDNGEEIIAFCDTKFYNALMSSSELDRRLDIGNFKKGSVDTAVKTLNDCAIIRVPSARMKSEYVFNDGTSSTGFSVASGALNIGFIVMPRKAVKLIKKTEKVRHFSPDQNQELDAHKLDYRLIYDALVKNSQVGTIHAYTYTN